MAFIDKPYERSYTSIELAANGTYRLIPDGILENAIIRAVQINNRSTTSDMAILYNGSSSHVDIVAAGGIVLIERPFSWLLLQNLDAGNAIAAGEIYLTLFNYPPGLARRE